jgi:predicted TIM-barrel fold metal-dependent hydrolase
MSKPDLEEPVFNLIRPYESIGVFFGRKPQRHRLVGTRVISSDSHVGLGGEDVFYDRAPASLKDRVPRVYLDEDKGYWTCSFNGKPVYPPGTEVVVNSVEGRPGVWNVDVRVADMDAEGIDAEIAFPQVLPLTLFTLKDFEAREFIMSEYNRYLARQQAKAPGRFYGVGVPNYWDPAQAHSSVQAIKTLGLKVLMLPCNPGTFTDGRPIRYSLDEMRPLWQALQDADLTVCFHIGENAGFGGKGAFPAAILNNMLGPDFRQLWAQLVFGGILDDFPKLRIVFAEANIHWVPGMLQDADMIPESFAGLIDYTPKLTPSEYWYRNCYATFIHDPAGLRLLDKIGIRNAMWSVDYPHNEGAFGYTGAAIDVIVKQVGEPTAKLLCGANASACFRI